MAFSLVLIFVYDAALENFAETKKARSIATGPKDVMTVVRLHAANIAFRICPNFVDRQISAAHFLFF
jgi:phosphotransacetylase